MGHHCLRLLRSPSAGAHQRPHGASRQRGRSGGCLSTAKPRSCPVDP